MTRVFLAHTSGEEVADEAAAVFLGLDSFAAGVNLSATSYPTSPTKLPRVAQSCCGKFGPCADLPTGPSHGSCKADSCSQFVPNVTCPAVQFGFLDTLEALKPRVRGAANRARFRVWQASFEYFAEVGGAQCHGTPHHMQKRRRTRTDSEGSGAAAEALTP